VNYFKVDKRCLDYLCDKSKHKQGRLFTRIHLPIHSPDKLSEDPLDYILILAWNLVDEIMKQLKDEQGFTGKFIVPIPEPRIV